MAEPQHKEIKQVGPDDWVIYDARHQEWNALTGQAREKVLAQPKPEPPGAVAQFTSGVASGIALGEPFTREAAKWLMEKGGMPVARQEPLTPHARGSRYAGMALGSIPSLLTIAKQPILHGVGGLARTRLGGTILSLLRQGYAKAPWTTFGLEGAAGYGAGYGSEKMRGTGLEPAAEVVGAALPVGVMNYLPRSIASLAYRAGKPIWRAATQAATAEGRRKIAEEATSPEGLVTRARALPSTIGEMARETSFLPTASPVVTKDGVQTLQTGTLPVQTAQSILREKLGADPSGVLRSLDEPPLSPTTTIAQRTGSGELIDMERHFQRQKGVDEIGAWDQTNLANQAFLAQQAENIAPASRLGDVARREAEQVRTRAAELGSRVETVPRTTISSQVADDMFTAFRENRDLEKSLWTQARESHPKIAVSTKPVLDEWKSIIQSVDKAQQGEIPQFIYKLFPDTQRPAGGETVTATEIEFPISRQFGVEENPYQIQSTISMLREVARLNPRTYKAKIASDLANAASGEMDRLSRQGLLPGYNEAREFTKNRHLTLDKNPRIWKLFRASGRPGSESDIVNNPEVLFERLGFGGTAGATRSADANTIRQLLDFSAFGGGPGNRNNQSTIDGLSDHFLQRFMEASDGGLNVTQAEKFMKTHQDLWNAKRFPELVTLGDDLKLFTQQARRSTEVSTLQDSLNRIMASDNPEAVFASMRKLTGRSDRELWKTALLRRVIRNQTGDRIGELYQAGLDEKGGGQRLVEALNSPRQRRMFELVFSPEEVKNLQKVGKEWNSVEQALITGGPDVRSGVSPGSELNPNSFLGSIMEKLFFGGRFGGALAAQLPPFSLVKGAGKLTVAGALARGGKGHAEQLVGKSFEQALQQIIANESMLRTALTDTSKLDTSKLKQLSNMSKGLYGSVMSYLDMPPWRPLLGESTQRGFLKAQIPQEEEYDPRKRMTREEQEAARKWFQENPASLAPEIRVPPRTSGGSRTGPMGETFIGPPRR
jgi:hypothetical protein